MSSKVKCTYLYLERHNNVCQLNYYYCQNLGLKKKTANVRTLQLRTKRIFSAYDGGFIFLLFYIFFYQKRIFEGTIQMYE